MLRTNFLSYLLGVSRLSDLRELSETPDIDGTMGVVEFRGISFPYPSLPQLSIVQLNPKIQ